MTKNNTTNERNDTFIIRTNNNTTHGYDEYLKVYDESGNLHNEYVTIGTSPSSISADKHREAVAAGAMVFDTEKEAEEMVEEIKRAIKVMEEDFRNNMDEELEKYRGQHGQYPNGKSKEEFTEDDWEEIMPINVDNMLYDLEGVYVEDEEDEEDEE